MLRAVNLTKSYGAQLVLDSCTFDVGVGQRLALVGYNGAGKTTLLKVLAGVEQPDSGSVSLQAGTVVGYLPQDGAALGNDTVERYLRAAAGLDDASWAAQRYRAETILSGFGLGDVAMGEQLTNLSSGQRTKVALAGILLRPADLLLLDEPTNNLDLPALLWLEEYLAASASTVVVVSHDRRFLDRVANGVMELDWRTQRVAIEAGSYSAYLDRQREARAHQLLQYRQQREEIAQLEGEIASKKAAASKPFKRKQPKDNDKYTDSFKSDRTQIKFGRVAKNLEKRIEHMDAVERPVERQPLTIDLAALPRGGNRDIELVGAEARYPSFHLGPIDLHIAFGNRVAMVGPNGSGKSTLLKVLTGKLEPAAGKVSVGSGVCFGQLMQEHENLPRTESPVRFIASRVAVEEHDIFARLVQSGFSREQVRQPIADLSPGGRARLTLVYFSYLAVNTLVLDEPTNHLDLEAMEALDELLLSYVGTVVLVTHDRYFLERARPSYVYQIDGGKLKLVLNLDALVSDSVTRARKLLRQLNSV